MCNQRILKKYSYLKLYKHLFSTLFSVNKITLTTQLNTPQKSQSCLYKISYYTIFS